MSEQTTSEREEPDIPQGVLDRLMALQVQARRVNGSTPEGHPGRAASVELSGLIADLVGQGVTRTRLARILGVTPGAVGARLGRHGYEGAPPSMREPDPSRRGQARQGRPGRRQDECKRGHPLTIGHPNVRVDPKSGRRICRECARLKGLESQARRQAGPEEPRLLSGPQPDIPADVVDRLLDLYVQARRVNGGTPEGHPDRVASVELSALLADLVSQGVPMRRLSRVMGLSKDAVAHRLTNHGYHEPVPSRRPGAAAYAVQPAQQGDECKRGHPLTVGHPNVRVADGRRSCRECERLREQERREKVQAVSDPWAVYEWEYGIVWSVTPATEVRAEQEAAAVSEPGHVHTAVPLSVAEHLRNAHAYGRQQGHAEAKARAAARGAAS